MIWLNRVLASLVGILVLAALIAWGMQRHYSKAVDALQAQALAAESRANDLQAEAERHKAVADGYAAQVGTQDKAISDLRNRIAKIRASQ